jgi:hypothetical protein
MQVRRPASELLHRLRISAGRQGHEVAFVADVNAGHVPVYDLQPRILGLQLAFQFPPLFAVELAFIQALKGRLLSLRHMLLSLWI